MKKYIVHAYVIVRVKLDPVEAESQTDAIAKAMAQHERELWPLFDQEKPAPGIQHTEYSEEQPSGFLVDEDGDEGYTATMFYKGDGITPDPLTTEVKP